MKPDERIRLIDDLIEGVISEAEFIRLEAEFSIDPEARREYYDRLALSSLLETEAATSVSERIVSFPGGRMQPSWMAVAAVVIALVAIVAVVVPRPQAPASASVEGLPAEEEASGFAVLVGQANAVWRNLDSPSDGSLVPAGELELESGVAHLELFSGVTVIVEGAAQFEIESPMEMTVARGKVRAHVPDAAHGFRIHTERGDIVDLGTEFAVNVSPERAELHVLDGEVEWHPTGAEMRPLNKGEGLAWDETGQGTDVIANGASFIGTTEMRDQLAVLRKDREAGWTEYSVRLESDPRLLAYYRTGLGSSWDRRLDNVAHAGAGTVRQGAIVAAVRSSDRWGNPQGALDFSPTGSRVRVNVPGEYQSITLLCWVKINSLDRWYNSLFLTDGHELHEPHWQIMDDGRLFFSVKKNDTWDPKKGEKDKYIFYSPSFWKPSLSGRWLMIATTYDIESKQVTHYLNGKVLSREAIPAEYLVDTVSIGNASLCNWGQPERDEPRFAVRNLNGSMSEFALFEAALSETEIAEIYTHGKP